MKHPTWNMGRKVTLDSATMFNKGLEVIEARWLFDVDYDHIEVLVQPQSLIHSMVEYEDGSVIAQIGNPDMRLPIQFALTYPHRLPSPSHEFVDWKQVGSIITEQPDVEVFRSLRLAFEAGKRGGNATTAFNAANEEAIASFIKGQLSFLSILTSWKKRLPNGQAVISIRFLMYWKRIKKRGALQKNYKQRNFMLNAIIAPVIVFAIIVIVHEGGHFFMAKLTGMKVDEFAVGFGPKIVSFRKGETLYSLRAIPLGGYNKIAGMNRDDLDDPRAFRQRPTWAKLLVIAGGALFNILLAFLFLQQFFYQWNSYF